MPKSDRLLGNRLFYYDHLQASHRVILSVNLMVVMHVFPTFTLFNLQGYCKCLPIVKH